MSLRLIIEQVTREMAVAVPPRFIPSSNDAYPKISPAFSRMSCLPSI